MGVSTLNIIKIGGNVIDNEEDLNDFLEKFSALSGKKILVHGGGKIATRLATELGVDAKLVEGRRITDAEMLNIVTMVYAGLTNKSIVSKLQNLKCDALGLSGADGDTIRTMKRPVKDIDYGFVGDMMHDSINKGAIKKVLEAGFVPVFSAITHNGLGQLLNTNADTIASSLAVALSDLYETSLIYCFEKNGVLRDVNDENSVVNQISAKDFVMMKEEGIIHAGMIPKLQNAFDAIRKGVKHVHIGNANNLHLFQQGHFGTCLVQK
ncbi:acetylglutamate kinase [Sphingobacterium sp. SYP-B4668]|uniref:acetylglutamate kinase n=1 Tax=Sphingobacterium sp. SYP-B4668 TaxID=2996035 RepID=UPI0022DDC757|nr:acetylglutamate kinase [Sphingobacterium sp. SYP-B4668]